MAQRVSHIVAKLATGQPHSLVIGSFDLSPGSIQTQARFISDPPDVRLLCNFIHDFIVEHLPAQSFSDQPGNGVPAGALLARNQQVWTIEQVAFLAPPWSLLTGFQEFVCLKNGDLLFDLIFNINHNNFRNSQCPPE